MSKLNTETFLLYNFTAGNLRTTIYIIGRIAISSTCPGIEVGVAYKYKASLLSVISSAVSYVIGVYATKILSDTIITEVSVITLAGPNIYNLNNN